MALTPNAARERAEEWLQQVQKQVKTASSFIQDKRDEVERRVEDVVGRILASLQIVTTREVAELDAKLKTIAKRLDQIEHKKAKAS